MILLLLSCAQPPPACAQMCQAAADLYGGCLEGWGADWSAAGYVDQADFLDACETWVWEQQLLETRDLPATCADRTRRYSAPAATCEEYTEDSWD
jgi:hypothetical protein